MGRDHTGTFFDILSNSPMKDNSHHIIMRGSYQNQIYIRTVRRLPISPSSLRTCRSIPSEPIPGVNVWHYENTSLLVKCMSLVMLKYKGNLSSLVLNFAKGEGLAFLSSSLLLFLNVMCRPITMVVQFDTLLAIGYLSFSVSYFSKHLLQVMVSFTQRSQNCQDLVTKLPG